MDVQGVRLHRPRQQFEQAFVAEQLGRVFVVGICVKFYDRCL